MRTSNDLNDFIRKRDALLARLRELQENRDFLNHPLMNPHYDRLVKNIELEIAATRGTLFDLLNAWNI